MTFFKRVFIVIPILWLGFVLAISFMEAWLKFQAEGMTQTLGLSVGRIIFSTLNKVEIFFVITTVIAIIAERSLFEKSIKYVLVTLGSIVALQSLHLLPVLDSRAEMIINGLEPTTASYFHFYYIALEIIKIIVLTGLIHKTLQKLIPIHILEKQKSTDKFSKLS